MRLRSLLRTVDHRLQAGRLANLTLRLGCLATGQFLLLGALFGLLHLLEDVLFERANVGDLYHAALQALALRVLFGLLAHLALVLLDLLEDLILLTAGQPIGLFGWKNVKSTNCNCKIHFTYSSVL